MKKFIKILAFSFILSLISTNVFAAKYISKNIEYDGEMHYYNAEEVFVNVDGKLLGDYSMIPLVMNDRVLVSARDVFTELGCDIAWNNDNREVTVYNDDIEIVIPIDRKVIFKNGQSISIDVAPKIIDDYTMIPLRVVAESLDCKVSFDNSTRTAYILSPAGTKNTLVQAPGPVVVPEPATEQVTEAKLQPAAAVRHNTGARSGGKVVLWDTISSVSANDSAAKQTPVEGVDVLCPTWFEIKSDGSINNVSGKGYVVWAHSQGYEVWGLVTNSFSYDVASAILNDKAKGDKIIEELLGYIIDLGADGINVDFENIYTEDGDAFVDFMRRLADRFHEMGLTVTVDTFMPTEYNEKYHMADMGEICDYVLLMAYDEHFSTSPQAGSVSSLPWVEKYLGVSKGIMNMNKLILGCPFYTRIWVTDAENNVIANESSGMDGAMNVIEKNGAQIGFDSETGQNYAEYPSGQGTTKIWLEDGASLSSRLALSLQYGCGGCAFWRRGFENEEAWDIINEYY